MIAFPLTETSCFLSVFSIVLLCLFIYTADNVKYT